MGLRDRAATLSKNQKAVAGLVKVIAFGVIAGVVIYCDIQFIQVMWKSYPDGVAKIFSMIGAVATGASVLALIAAEAYWFSRGPQMVFGWIFTAIEALISAANVILGFELIGGVSHLDSFMASYLWFCPATPVVAAVGWILIFNLDEGQKARHDEREMQDDIAASDREHAKAVHASKMRLKARYLESTTTYLDQIADDPQVQAGLRLGAWKFAGEQLRELTGMYLTLPAQPSALPPAPVVDSNPPAQSEKPTEKKADPGPFRQLQEELAALKKVQEELAALKKQQPVPETNVHIAPQKAAPAQTAEQEYIVNRPAPDTEQLSPLTVAPSEGTNGNGANSH